MRRALLVAGLVVAACSSTASSVREDAPPPDLAAVRADLLARLAEERVRAGLGSLAPDAKLDDVALRHSEEMRDRRFFGHDSPTTGSPADRVARAGLPRALVLENIGRGTDAESLWANLTATAEQRLHLTHPQATHTGIGIAVEQGEEGALLVATQLFAQLAQAIDVAAAPARVRTVLDEVRRARGAAALASDPALDSVARATATIFFTPRAPSERDTIAAANTELARTVRGYASVGAAMAVVRSLDEARELEASIDPAARALGIGIAQGNRPESGPLTIAVVITWASGTAR